ncbi:ribosomal RNA small subunit methyltransferase H-like isoform X3 [Corvus kubaryi]|uniref:ribosomal RNA small subunit methyltransferase H-like isoform X3 n=1 Tax=Corvus kubaryi TaxID=68294 RepID=UPI001C05DB63|nr:ribosomal RNA small subunit methyltransferase H-like isoform X3 [Corvus kubaryi]
MSHASPIQTGVSAIGKKHPLLERESTHQEVTCGFTCLTTERKWSGKPSSALAAQRFLDMTFGAGGHTAALLEKASDITVYALDRDPTAYKIAQQLSESYP